MYVAIVTKIGVEGTCHSTQGTRCQGQGDDESLSLVNEAKTEEE